MNDWATNALAYLSAPSVPVKDCFRKVGIKLGEAETE
jgi:hypothetical protein